MAELLIRAAMNDHNVVGDLLAPGASPDWASRRALFSGLVADAHVADARPVLADHARAAGIPYVIDPDTTFVQSEVAPGDRWASLPFGSAEAVDAADVKVAKLAAEVLEFEVDNGATRLVAPYFYAQSPMDPWFRASLAALDETAEYLDRNDIHLPVTAVLCAQLQSFGNPTNWSIGIDRFVARAEEIGADTIGLCLSPAGDGADSYGKVVRLFDAALRARTGELRVVAWRQGIYGPALVAAGIDGYECGMGTGEQTDVKGRQSSRKPRDDDSSWGGAGGIFIEPLNRSVIRSVGRILLGDNRTRAKVMCDDEGCCYAVAATIDNSRDHAVRTRARMLQQLMDQPHRAWRLNHIARQAASAVPLVQQANAVLEAEGVKQRLKSRNQAALADVAVHLAEQEPGTRTA